MLFYTIGQSRIFLTMLYAGLAVGLYAGLDSAARRLFGAGRILSLMMDLMFGLVLAAIVLTALICAADGELRLYSLMGVLCGYLLCAGTLRPLLGFLFRQAGRFLIKPCRWAGRLTIVKKLLR